MEIEWKSKLFLKRKYHWYEETLTESHII